MSPWMTGTMKQFQNRCLLESEIGESTTAAATRLREHSTKSIDLVSKQPIVPAAVGADCLAFVSEDNYICGCPDFDCQVKDWPHQFGWRSICPSGETLQTKPLAHAAVGRTNVLFWWMDDLVWFSFQRCWHRWQPSTRKRLKGSCMKTV